jgi:hypothetical protein
MSTTPRHNVFVHNVFVRFFLQSRRWTLEARFGY